MPELKIGDIVQTCEGIVMRITGITGSWCNGDYFGIRGHLQGKIKIVKLTDLKHYKDVTWIKE